MSAPLYDSLCALADSDPLRLHMPGHKGISGGLFREIAKIDFTEITPTGNLYTGEGKISDAEDLCAAYGGGKDALFFTCGSTQAIHTMLAEAIGMGGTLIMDRGCHKSIYHAMALLDITPYYIYPEPIGGSGLPGPVSLRLVESALECCPSAKAVFLTSPTYYGIVTELAPIAELCHRHGVFLLVDQAHGAHLPTVGLPSGAQEGADLTVVSTHKTWPAMGSSSVLYIGQDAPFDKLSLKETAALFGTTSPSYPIMASIDYARDRLEHDMGDAYRRCAGLVRAFREKINLETPFHALSDETLLDPCRLTIDTLTAGLPGCDADELLQKENIYAEMSDERYLVLILTCCDNEAPFSRLWSGIEMLLKNLPIQTAGTKDFLPAAPRPVIRTSIRSAVFGTHKRMPLKDAAGQVSAGILAPYPPGIPVIAPGEEITEKHIAYLEKKRYNIMRYEQILQL